MSITKQTIASRIVISDKKEIVRMTFRILMLLQKAALVK